MVQSKPKSIKEDLKTGDFKNIYLLFGEERFLVSYYSKALEETGYDKDVFDGKVGVQEIIMAASTLPFLTEKRLIYVRDSKLFTSGRKDDSEAMAVFLPNVPPETIMVFVEADIDRRSRLYKKAAELGRVVDCEPPTPQALTNWIGKLLKEKGKTISPPTITQLIRTVGGNMTTISQEIEKLAAYSASETEITTTHITAICTPTLESKIFDLIKCMSVGQVSTALSLYRNMLILKESPLMILSMIIRQLRILLLVKSANAKKMPRTEIAKTLNLRDFIVMDAQEQCRRFSQEQLLDALEMCLDVDVKIKTGLVAADVGVEMLIVRFGVN